MAQPELAINREMAKYSCVDDTLKRFEWQENYRKLSDPAKIKILKMYLRFLKTFLVSTEKLSTEDADLKDLISYVQEWVQNAGKTIRSLCANAVEESKVASEWQGKIDDLITSKIRISYRPVLQSDAAVSNSCLVALIDSVLNNLSDLQSYKRIDSTKKQIEVLEVKFRFLWNFVWFSSQSCIQHQKLDDLLRLIESVATTAACLSFQCLFEDTDTITETKFSQVLLTIQLIEPELRYAHIRGLKFSLSSQLVSTSPMGFLHCFLNDLKELLSPISYLKASARDHVQNLLEQLNFVIAFLNDPLKPDDLKSAAEGDKKKVEDLLARAKAVATKTAHVIQLLLVSSKNEDVATKVNPDPLFDLINEIDSIKKAMIKEKYLDMWKSIKSNMIPKANALGLIDFLLGTIDVVLNNKTDSITFVRHQLEILQGELVRLRSFPCNKEHLEKELTTLHEAKHAIGSLIIRESPLWHCMLQLSDVIKKIQTVNNKVAATCVSDQTIVIGDGIGAQNSDSSTSVAMAPVTSEIDVGLENKETEAAELTVMHTNE